MIFLLLKTLEQISLILQKSFQLEIFYRRRWLHRNTFIFQAIPSRILRMTSGNCARVPYIQRSSQSSGIE